MEKPTENPRVTRARELLAASEAARPTGDIGEVARWWGRCEQALADLLALLDEEAGR